MASSIFLANCLWWILDGEWCICYKRRELLVCFTMVLPFKPSFKVLSQGDSSKTKGIMLSYQNEFQLANVHIMVAIFIKIFLSGTTFTNESYCTPSMTTSSIYLFSVMHNQTWIYESFDLTGKGEYQRPKGIRNFRETRTFLLTRHGLHLIP